MSGRTFPLALGVNAGLTQVSISQLVIAGWTGRDAAALEKHIRELEALGVRRPATTPIFYRVSVARLALEETIEVCGTQSSGEVELLLLQCAGRLWIGAGSDHTDREVEAYGVTVSKQMCDKPFARQFWAYDEVCDHWDALTLRSRIREGGQWVAYQNGHATAFLEPHDLIRRFTGADALPEGTLMFCGTLGAIGGVRPAEQFAFELEDPIREQKISSHYRTVTLPIAG